MTTYDELMNMEYYGKFMDDASSVPSYEDVIALMKMVRKSPMGFDFNIDDIRERCINVFNLDPVTVEHCVTILDCFWGVQASGMFNFDDIVG